MKDTKKMTLADHAETWARENSEVVSPRDTPDWQTMYERWHAFVFAGW